MCKESPVAKKCYADAVTKYGSDVHFLGIIGDQSHQTRKSGHNCGAGAELSCTHPEYAHAVDIGVANSRVGYDIVNQLKKDSRVHYMIYRGVGYRPDHRGGGTFSSFDHESHVHVSFGCGTTFDVRPFFGAKKVMTPQAFMKIFALAKKKAAEEKNRFLTVKNPYQKGRDVDLVQQATNAPKTGEYGPGTRDAVKEFQGFWKHERTGNVDRATWELVWFYHLAKYFGY